MLTTLVSFIVLLIILIFVHELGHFLAAKILGVRVETFSLGFPPKMFSKKVGETVYQLAWIPIGGYVKLLGEEPGEEMDGADKPRSFSHKPVWAKSIIVLAGPFFNIVFAVFAIWALSWASGIQHVGTTLGPMSPDSPIALAGAMRDDVVTGIGYVGADGKVPAMNETKYFDELGKAVSESNGRELALRILRDGRELTLRATPVEKEESGILGDKERGWYLGLTPRTLPVLGRVPSGMPAHEAGILPGDLVVAMDGVPTPDWQDVIKAIQGRGEDKAVKEDGTATPIIITVSRDGSELSIPVTPDLEPIQDLDGKTSFTPVVGISPRTELLTEPVGPISAFGMGLSDTWRMAKLTILSVVKLLQNKISPKLMGGPIMIAEIAGKSARHGLANFILLMAFISVNLAILNLLPLPVLDGGQFVIFLLEGIRRKPISLRVREITQWVGIGAMVALMVLVFYNDISRLVTKFTGPPAQVERKAD